MKEAYKVESYEDIHKVLADKIKNINSIMPKYKAIRGTLISEEQLIKIIINKKTSKFGNYTGIKNKFV